MGSSGKKRTTMAKLNRESKLRDKRAEKQARKAARKASGAGGRAHVAFGGGQLDAELPGLDTGAFEDAEPESVAAVADVTGNT